MPEISNLSSALPEFDLDSTHSVETIVAQLTEIALPFIQSTPTQLTPTITLQVNPLMLLETRPSTTEAPEVTPTTPSPIEPALPILPTGTSTIEWINTATEELYTIETSTPVPPIDSSGWIDSFDQNARWPVYTDEHIQMQILNSQLIITAFTANRANPYDGWLLTDQNASNFSFSINATPQECSGLDRFGIMARANQGVNGVIKGYLFGISCNGEYSLRIWDGQKIVMLIGWTQHSSINKGPGQMNQLEFRAEGNTLSLFANGTLLDVFEDDTFSEGLFGFFTGAVMTNDFSVIIDQVEFKELP